MRTARDLSVSERQALGELRGRIALAFPGLDFAMTLFGSRARDGAEPDSDMDVLVEVGAEHLAFADKRTLRRIATDVTLESGLVVSLLVIDRATRRERGDFSVFENIREEGIAV
jgi:predicted nucleotidyltransferase